MARLLKTEPTHCDSALQLSKEELFLSGAHLFSSPHKHSALRSPTAATGFVFGYPAQMLPEH